MATGLDYSAGQIPGAAVRAAGHSFVVRYVGTPGRRKNITAGEYRDLVAAGVTVWLVYENSTEDAMGGFTGGAAAARAARADANAVGYPAGGPIFFCADRHLSQVEIPTGLAYLDGAASVLGKAAVGAYGFSEFINPARSGGHATFFWQCGSRSTVGSGVHLYQRNTGSTNVGGISCDVNDLLAPILGDDVSFDDVIGTRPDGSPITAKDALVNVYLGALYGGGDSGPNAVYPSVNRILLRLEEAVIAGMYLGGSSTPEGKSMFQMLAGIAGKDPAVAQLSPEAGAEIARNILTALPTELAQQIVDEWGRRIAPKGTTP